MLDWLQQLVTASPVSYMVIAAAVWLDAWFPVIPGESLVITGGVLAAQEGLSPWLVALAGFVGAVSGDNFTYLLGRRAGPQIEGRLFGGKRSRRLLDWARRQLRERRWIVVVGRFVPGGRTAVMFAAGAFGMHHRRAFLPLELAGALLWAVYVTALGFSFGQTFQDSLWLPILVSLAVAGAISVAAEALRRTTSSGGAAAGGPLVEPGPRASWEPHRANGAGPSTSGR